jgi:hypothetical protein
MAPDPAQHREGFLLEGIGQAQRSLQIQPGWAKGHGRHWIGPGGQDPAALEAPEGLPLSRVRCCRTFSMSWQSSGYSC